MNDQPDQLPHQEIEELLHKVAGGDRAAFNALYDASSRKLFGICMRICGNSEAAEDVTQESFVKIWQRADQFSAELGSPLAWMGTIARNAAIDWYRKQRKGETASDQALEHAADPAALADEVMDTAQQNERIIHCIQKLGMDQKSLILGAFFSGSTYQQLALRIGAPLNTVKSRVRRGLINLRKCLEND